MERVLDNVQNAQKALQPVCKKLTEVAGNKKGY